MGELDVVAVENQAVIAGECKSGGRLEAKDIRSARSAVEFGVSRVFFASASQFDDESPRMIAQFEEWVNVEHGGVGVDVWERDVLLGGRGVSCEVIFTTT